VLAKRLNAAGACGWRKIGTRASRMEMPNASPRCAASVTARISDRETQGRTVA
jgi:hypothetical protein